MERLVWNQGPVPPERAKTGGRGLGQYGWMLDKS